MFQKISDRYWPTVVFSIPILLQFLWVQMFHLAFCFKMILGYFWSMFFHQFKWLWLVKVQKNIQIIVLYNLIFKHSDTKRHYIPERCHHKITVLIGITVIYLEFILLITSLWMLFIFLYCCFEVLQFWNIFKLFIGCYVLTLL